MTLAFAAFSCILKLNTLNFDHEETDEQVYWHLAENILKKGEYSLRGTELLPTLSQEIYNRPLFHHPPLFPWLLIPFVKSGAIHAAIIISWFGHLLAIFSVGIIGYGIMKKHSADPAHYIDWYWIPLLGIATDPVLTFVSANLWIDSLMAGLIAFSAALVYLSTCSERKNIYLILGGIFLGLAGLAKIPGLLGAGLAWFLILTSKESSRDKTKHLILFHIPCIILVLPWFIIFYRQYGVLLPGWIKPDEWLIKNNAFISSMLHRPFYYYIAKIILTQPLFFVLLFLSILRLVRQKKFSLPFPFFWFLVFLLIPTWQGIAGHGFQMRYIAPLFPSLYLMIYSEGISIAETRRNFYKPFVIMLLVFAAIQATMYLFWSEYEEFFSLAELIGIIKL